MPPRKTNPAAAIAEIVAITNPESTPIATSNSDTRPRRAITNKAPQAQVNSITLNPHTPPKKRTRAVKTALSKPISPDPQTPPRKRTRAKPVTLSEYASLITQSPPKKRGRAAKPIPLKSPSPDIQIPPKTRTRAPRATTVPKSSLPASENPSAKRTRAAKIAPPKQDAPQSVTEPTKKRTRAIKATAPTKSNVSTPTESIQQPRARKAAAPPQSDPPTNKQPPKKTTRSAKASTLVESSSPPPKEAPKKSTRAAKVVLLGDSVSTSKIDPPKRRTRAAKPVSPRQSTLPAATANPKKRARAPKAAGPLESILLSAKEPAKKRARTAKTAPVKSASTEKHITNPTKPVPNMESTSSANVVVSVLAAQPSKRKASLDVFYDAQESKKPRLEAETGPSPPAPASTAILQAGPLLLETNEEGETTDVSEYVDAQSHPKSPKILQSTARLLPASTTPHAVKKSQETHDIGGSRKRGRDTSQAATQIDAKRAKLDPLAVLLENWQGGWLLKSEPDSRIEDGKDVKFSIDDLKNCTEPEPWSGVRNHGAKNNMCAMKKGTLAFFYHSNCKTPGIAGIMEIVQEATPDVTAFDRTNPYYDPLSSRLRPKWFNVHVAFRQKFDNPERVSLAQLRRYSLSGGPLEKMQLFKQSRLSVTRVSKQEWNFILDLAGQSEHKYDIGDTELETTMMTEDTTLLDNVKVPKPAYQPGPSPEPTPSPAPVQDLENYVFTLPELRFSDIIDKSRVVSKSARTSKASESSMFHSSSFLKSSSPIRRSPTPPGVAGLFKRRESPIKKALARFIAKVPRIRPSTIEAPAPAADEVPALSPANPSQSFDEHKDEDCDSVMSDSPAEIAPVIVEEEHAMSISDVEMMDIDDVNQESEKIESDEIKEVFTRSVGMTFTADVYIDSSMVTPDATVASIVVEEKKEELARSYGRTFSADVYIDSSISTPDTTIL